MAFLQHFLSVRATEKNIFYHYPAKLAPFIFISAVYGLRNLFLSDPVKKLGVFKTPFLMTLILAISLSVHLAIGAPIMQVLNRITLITSQAKKHSINQKFIDMIPKDAAVVATFRFLDKLSQRKELYSFHHIYMGKYSLSEKNYSLPERLDYALIDFEDFILFNGFWNAESHNNVKKFFNSYKWEVLDSDGSVVMFRNSGKKDLTKIFEVIDEAPQTDVRVNGRVEDEIELVGFDWKVGTEEKLWEIRFSFIWECHNQTKGDYAVFITLKDEEGNIITEDKHHLCYRIYPTYDWKKGEIIRDAYWYIFPQNLPKKKYLIKLAIVEENQRILVKVKSDRKELFDEEGLITLLEI